MLDAIKPAFLGMACPFPKITRSSVATKRAFPGRQKFRQLIELIRKSLKLVEWTGQVKMKFLARPGSDLGGGAYSTIPGSLECQTSTYRAFPLHQLRWEE